MKHCFGIDIEWTKENFSTRGHQFYKGLFQTNTEGQTGIKYPIFIVTIGNTKETGHIEYNLQDPLVVYHQNDSNICCVSSLASSFTASGENNAARAIKILIEESLYFQYQGYKDMIYFSNDIMPDQVINLGDQSLHYNIKKWKKGQFEILHDISEKLH